MEKAHCFFLGKLKKPNGLTGALELFLDVDDFHPYLNLDYVLAERHHQLVPLFFSQPIQVAGNKLIARFKDINHIDQASEWSGVELYLPMDLLPELVSNQQYYFHELPGFIACTPEGKVLGTIKSILEHGPMQWLVVQRNEQEALLPLNDELFGHIERETNRFFISLAPGMGELYPFLFEE